MPWCPKCKEEYIDGISRCRVCGGDLEEKKLRPPPQKNPPNTTRDKAAEKFLFEPENQVDFAFVTEALAQANIPYRVLERGSGEYMRIYFGFNVTGKKVYVTKQDYKRAKEIYDDVLSLKDTSADDTPPDAEISDDTLFPYITIRKIAIWMLMVYLAIRVFL